MLTNVIALNVIRRRRVYCRHSATTFVYFHNGGYEPEVVISNHILHLAGLCKNLCKVQPHDNQTGCTSTMFQKFVMHEVKREFANW